MVAVNEEKVNSGSYTGLLTPYHRDLCHARGLTDDTIEKARLWSGSPEAVRQALGYNPNNSPGLMIPYFHPLTGELRYHRVRMDTPPIIDGKPAKYLAPRGKGNLLYFVPDPRCAQILQDTAELLYFAEAPLKALAAWQRGFFAVAANGVWGWRGQGFDRQSRPIADLDLIAWKEQSWMVVYDSDVVLNLEVQRARQALGKEMYRRGAASVYGVNIPGLDGTTVGWDDYLAAHSVDEFNDLPVFTLPPTDLPPFTSPLSSLLDGPVERIEWAIEGLQPVGASGWRIADPKTGKSWSMLEEAYCLTIAKPVYGHFRVPRPRKVLIIEEEDSKRRIQRRLHRIIHAHGGVAPNDEFFRYSVKKGVRLDEPQWQEVIEWEIRQFRPELVYLDVFTRLHAKDINDAQDMSAIVRFLDTLSCEYGCAFVLLHHPRKNSAGGDEYNEILGSRVLGGFGEASLFFSKTKEKGILRVKVSLKDEPEDGSFEPEFLIKLTDTPDQEGTLFEYLGAPAENKAASELREKIKTYVAYLTEFQTAAEIGKAVGCSKPTARDHLKALYDLKVVDRRKRGAAYVYGPAEQPAHEEAA
jgi:AAA domain/Domain of unknown function (DUF3854)